MSYSASVQRNPNLSIPSLDQSLKNEVLPIFGDSWWTGLAPENCAGFDKNTQSLHALPPLDLTSPRQKILEYFDNSWTLTELLFSSLKSESTYIRPPYHELRHPLIFYYGHPAVLYYNKLRLAGFFSEPVDLYLEKVLETGVDEMSWDDMAKNQMTWPSVKTVHAYRKKIYKLVRNVILAIPEKGLGDVSQWGPHSPHWALFMGFEHEKIHFETTSVLIRELPLGLVEAPRYWPGLHPSSEQKTPSKPTAGKDFVPAHWIPIEGGSIQYGKSTEVPLYGWDNEYGTRCKEIVDFQITNQLISNGEYYEFVASLAYVEDQYWSREGLQWRKFRNTKRPSFWVAYGPEGLHDYKLRTLFNVIDMPWSWPAEVNFHEAQAFVRWKQNKDKANLHYRLMTEPEHIQMRGPHYQHQVQNYNLNFKYSSAQPVQGTDGNKNIQDLFGNVWQWAEDQFNPLDGFKVHPLYDDFSTPCFDGKHQIILGGSFMSCGDEATQWARFHFRPHFFQHAGFRMAASLDGSVDNGATRLRQSQEYQHPKRTHVLDQMQNEGWWKDLFQPLEMNSTELKEHWNLTLQKILQFEQTRHQLSPKGTALDAKTNELKAGFHVPYQGTQNFPIAGDSFEKLLKIIFEDLAPTGQQPGHPGYMAYVSGAGNSVSNMAQAISQTLNQFTGHQSLAPGLVHIENEALTWIKNLFSYPKTAGAIFTSGGSLATLSALSIARKTKMRSTDLSQARFYANQNVHHCVGKALAILGFPKQSLVLIPLDSDFKMDLLALEARLLEDQKQGFEQIAIIGTAGSTNTGAVDNISALAEISKKFSTWFHIDAAYGGFFYLAPSGQKTLHGIDQADSIVLDPHKSFALPYGTGCLLIREASQMKYDYAGASTYMPPENSWDFADISPELSRDYRGLRFWLPLKLFGVGPFILNLEEKLQLAQKLTQEIHQISDLELVAPTQLSIVTFKMKTDDQTRELLNRINESDQFFLTACQHQGQTVIRVCLLGFRTHNKQVDELIHTIRNVLQNMRQH